MAPLFPLRMVIPAKPLLGSETKHDIRQWLGPTASPFVYAAAAGPSEQEAKGRLWQSRPQTSFQAGRRAGVDEQAVTLQRS
jgi:hypothetical protein